MIELVKIFIDPGHGGTDSGAIGYGLLEKDLTLSISLRIRNLLGNYKDVQVRMSRDDDSTVSLKQRTEMANSWGADYLISVHINAGGGKGYEDFIHPLANTRTAQYQTVMHDEIIKEIGLADRGEKRGNFFVLRESNMSAILTENGFIDSPSDSDKLKQSGFIDKIAKGHVNGLVKIFGLESQKSQPPQWDGMELKKGQIGRIKILKPINLWTDDLKGNLQMVRILQPGEVYRVYGYRNKHGGQYDVGAKHWITKMDGYTQYETPSKALLKQAEEYFR